MKKLLMITGLALAVSAPFYVASDAAAEGDGKGKKFDRMFNHWDKDGNGSVSKREFLSAAEERFDKMDIDNDGEVTKREFKAKHDQMKDKMSERRKGKEGDHSDRVEDARKKAERVKAAREDAATETRDAAPEVRDAAPATRDAAPAR